MWPCPPQKPGPTPVSVPITSPPPPFSQTISHQSLTRQSGGLTIGMRRSLVALAPNKSSSLSTSNSDPGPETSWAVVNEWHFKLRPGGTREQENVNSIL